jgi:formylglycine-generating enzyme required for sulfatase activity
VWRRLAPTWLALHAIACGSSTDGAAPGSAQASSTAAARGAVLEAAENQSSASTSSTAKAAADPVVAIAATQLEVGSTPGDAGRDPTLEPPLFSVDLGPFDIDRAPYPNEAGRPPMKGVTREKAASLCKERGRRLCTEAEWELACKGPEGSLYAGRAGWDDACSRDPSSCASSFGVVAMGAYREWTSSDVAAVGDVKAGAAVRGAPSSASPLDRRCARRSSVEPSTSSNDLTFRCCGGAPNDVALPAPKRGATFERAELSASALEEMFGVIPQLSKLKDLKYFDAEAAARTVTSKADAGADPKGYILTTTPLSWRPVPGEELVVVTGLANEDSFIVALYRLPDGRHRVASSLVLKRDRGPVILAYDRSVDTRLEWSTCWQCPGESGRITYRDDRRVVITQE